MGQLGVGQEEECQIVLAERLSIGHCSSIKGSLL